MIVTSPVIAPRVSVFAGCHRIFPARGGRFLIVLASKLLVFGHLPRRVPLSMLAAKA